ncbi:MAG TPA: Gfo/Idh/MocA family oxidoreductase [Chloroflexota bacterium]|nr:Gfo/Idh/MocA family oxidoreductase [Chloroflexota bacterium]
MTRPFRVGIVGANRGGGYGRALAALSDQAAVTAICDVNRDVLAGWQTAQPELRRFGRFEDLLDSGVCDAVMLATPMELHAQQAILALSAGHHVLSEVIAACTIDDCWALVEAVESSGKIYMLAENYCYTRPAMMVRNLAEQGVFGDVSYGEGAYIHDCRPLMFDARLELTWRGRLGRTEPGNGYPTHSLGPVAQWLGCAGPGASDRLTAVVTLTTPSDARSRYARELLGPERPESARGFFRLGDSASTLLRTANGKVAYLRVDSASPRPHNMTHYVLQGADAAFVAARHPAEDPLIWIRGRSPGSTIGDEAWESLWRYAEEYEHPRWRERGEIARRSGHGGGDFFVVEDFVRAVSEGSAPPIDVYDAVTWSSVFPLSVESVRTGGMPKPIPDFRNRQR